MWYVRHISGVFYIVDADLRKRLLSETVEVNLVEFVTESAELKCGSDSEHYLDCSGENVECFHCLCFDLLMTDEINALLCAAEQNVYYLLCIC